MAARSGSPAVRARVRSFRSPSRRCWRAAVSTLRVLNVDDEPQARRAMRIALIARGFEVIDAASGEEGIEMVRAERPDVVLLDLTMPGMNGIEACRAICSFSDVPVV